MAKQERAEIGVIGGSGLYDLAGLERPEVVRVPTPFGAHSGPLVVGELRGRRVAFLPRHGRGHLVPPSAIPARANVYALKALGVTQVVGVSAVGSLRADYEPGHLVVPHQLVDWTKGRASTFFGEGLVVHVSLADPYCLRLRADLAEAARAAANTPVHDSGTYICMEGPQFSTRAESELYRFLKMDVIGMTAAPEAKLAREAELCYAGLALVTDYDCWHSGAEDVDADQVSQVMARNAEAAVNTLAALIEKLPADPECPCRNALAHAIITDRTAVPQVVRDQLELLIGGHLSH